jgi:hypothetical protein
MIASVVNLNGDGHYVHWGFIQISWANLLVIALMLLVFVAALFVPMNMPKKRSRVTSNPGPAPGTPPMTLPGDESKWSAKVRKAAVAALPPDKLLPDRQPTYVASWIYVFGVLTIASFVVVLVTGGVLALFGPAWWHQSSVGRFCNSLHLWSVEVFFFVMVLHLWGKFFMAAWRGKRRLTWVTGVVTFVVSIGAAFTGYLSQQNFDSEWISTQAKDGINSTGAGAWWNVLNFGQMLMWHIVLLPLAVLILVGLHVLLVRHRGVVPPFEVGDLSVEQPPSNDVSVGSPAVVPSFAPEAAEVPS